MEWSVLRPWALRSVGTSSEPSFIPSQQRTVWSDEGCWEKEASLYGPTPGAFSPCKLTGLRMQWWAVSRQGRGVQFSPTREIYEGIWREHLSLAHYFSSLTRKLILWSLSDSHVLFLSFFWNEKGNKGVTCWCPSTSGASQQSEIVMAHVCDTCVLR